MNKQRLTRRESRQRSRGVKLVNAAERVFVRTGFDAASVEHIAAEAGFSRGAFYSNFKSKDEIFLACSTGNASRAKTRSTPFFEAKRDAHARFRAARDWYADQWRQRSWTVLEAEFNLCALRQRRSPNG